MELDYLKVGLLGSFALTGWLSLLVLIGIYRRVRPNEGTYCAHCGAVLRKDPVRQLIVEQESLLGYSCGRCGRETFMPSHAG